MTRCINRNQYGLIKVGALVAQKMDAVTDLEVVSVPGGVALVGTDRPVFPADGEGPLRQLKLASFLMTSRTITNLQFSRFVMETGYKTDAERFGWSFVFRDAVANESLINDQVAEVPWWCKIPGADWLDPRGQGLTVSGFEQLPVVHVSWNDAAAYAMWAGGRLPTEVEWEHAARGGLGDVLYPWGDEEPSISDPKCHFGQVGASNLSPYEIGPLGADSFEPNGYGLFNMVGNVWEWTADTAIERNPVPQGTPPRKYLKGGSYLCHPNTCYRYRIAARISNTMDSTLGHTGFRIVFSN